MTTPDNGLLSGYILEALATLRFTGVQFRTIYIIASKAGWNQQPATISIPEISQILGISERQAWRELKQLVNMKVISNQSNRGGRGIKSQYSINPLSDWKISKQYLSSASGIIEKRVSEMSDDLLCRGTKPSCESVILAVFCSLALYTMVCLEHYGYLPHQSTFFAYNYPWYMVLFILGILTTVLVVVALMASYALKVLRDAKINLKEKNLTLEMTNKRLCEEDP